MRICLVSPPYDSSVRTVVGVTSPPLGLAYLAGALRHEYDVKIIDSAIMGYNFSDLRRELESFAPDVVGITSVTPSIPQAWRVANIAKQLGEGTTVVMGGPHVSFLPEQTLRECKDVDVIVRGEGEETFRDLAEAIDESKPLKGVRGISYRGGAKIVDNEARPVVKDIDRIAFPARDLLPNELYKFYGVKYTTMLTSRGCPFGCSFCSSSRLMGGRWRGRSPGNVLEEMREVYEEYGTGNIEFLDDTFTLNQKRAEAICDGIIDRGWDIHWGASSRVDTISKGLAEKMEKAGCWIVYLGIESGTQTVLDAVGKRITIEQAERAVKTVKDAGMKVLGSFIIGFLEDTRESIMRTIHFARRLGLDLAQFSILTPYPGTPLYDYAEKEGLLLTHDWSRYTATEPVMKLGSLTPRELKGLLRRSYLGFYLRPGTVWRWIRNNRFTFVKNGVKTAMNYLGGAYGG